MKKTTSRILLSALTVLALLTLGGCAQEKGENAEQNDPQAQEAVLHCCEAIFGSAEETGTYHIRVTMSHGIRQQNRTGTIAAMGSLRSFLMGKMRSRSFRPGER